MVESGEEISLYIGWDVGGWNCANNPRSRDALVVLDADRNILGQPWRGNLRETINYSTDTDSFISAILNLCWVYVPTNDIHKVVLGIDTPLGVSDAFRRLLDGKLVSESIENHEFNPYLYRYTERKLFEHGLKPLSAIKDMIGSQATKGMHLLAKFIPNIKQTGVWTDGKQLEAIEVYPSACKHSAAIESYVKQYVYAVQGQDGNIMQNLKNVTFSGIDHEDERDGLFCALLAWMYINEPEALLQPDEMVSVMEGWIFVPADIKPPSMDRPIMIWPAN